MHEHKCGFPGCESVARLRYPAGDPENGPARLECRTGHVPCASCTAAWVLQPEYLCEECRGDGFEESSVRECVECDMPLPTEWWTCDIDDPGICYCTACFKKTPCGQGRHREECPNQVIALHQELKNAFAARAAPKDDSLQPVPLTFLRGEIGLIREALILALTEISKDGTPAPAISRLLVKLDKV